MSKKAVFAAALVAAGLVAVYGMYQFQSSRLTASRLNAIREAGTRIAQAEKVEKAEPPKEAPKEDTRPVPAVALKEVGSAPAEFDVKFHTTKGDFVVRFHKDWSPQGVERVYQLVKTGYYDDNIFFRVLPGFVVQWGLAGDPAKTAKWHRKNVTPETPTQSNKAGTVSFAMAGRPDTRETQLFINLENNSRLDSMGFGPVGEVVSGMEAIQQLNSRYGEAASQQQEAIREMGNEFLDQSFPGLDRIIWAVVEEGDKAAEQPQPASPEGK